MTIPPLSLGVNIDHIATVRNARGSSYPEPLRAAFIAEQAGAHTLTIHLREDRRHIRDHDVSAIIKHCKLPVNLEIAATDEMVEIAIRERPARVCIVPENRQEVTTERGLDISFQHEKLAEYCQKLQAATILVTLFLDPAPKQIALAAGLQVDGIELHTAAYAEAREPAKIAAELHAIQQAAMQTVALGMYCHAGHGLTYANVGPIAAIAEISELNIGHFLVGEAIFVGLPTAIQRMQQAMYVARLSVVDNNLPVEAVT